MTVLDRAPAPVEHTDADGETAAAWMEPLRAFLVGLASAAITLVPLLLLALVALWSDGRSSEPASAALGVGALAWLALHGASIEVEGASISFLPLLLAALPLLAAVAGATRIVRASASARRSVRAPLAWWWAGYAAAGLIALGLTVEAPAHPAWLRLLGPLAVVPLFAATLALLRVRGTSAQDAARRHTSNRKEPDSAAFADDGEEKGSAGEWSAGRWWSPLTWMPYLWFRMPLTWRRAAAPGVRGAGWLIGAGALVVIGSLALHWQQVTRVQGALEPGVAGGILLVLLQLAALPNLAIWALSFLAGPGFHAVEGATASWGGIQGGLLPLVPVYGALPQPTSLPWIVRASVLVPVLIGALIARRSLRAIARLSSVRAKAATACAACVVAAVTVGVLDAVGGGSLGAYRLSDIGAPAHWLVLALLPALLVGALAWVFWDAWRLRR